LSVDHHNQDFLTPSRSQQKREAAEIFSIAERLSHEPLARLQKMGLPADVLEEVVQVQATHAPVARKRQLQYLAKRMRRHEPETFATALAMLNADRTSARRETALLHRLEAWRDRLVEEGDPALDALVTEYPQAERQHLRSLIRQARSKAGSERSTKAARALFRVLRDLLAQPPSLP